VTRFAFVYIIYSTFVAIVEFFTHWYVGGFRAGTHWLLEVLARLDRFFAFKITLRYFGQPLFQDRSMVGYVLGFIFRTLRLAVGGVVYLVVIGIAIVFYAAWGLLLPFILYKIFS